MLSPREASGAVVEQLPGKSRPDNAHVVLTPPPPRTSCRDDTARTTILCWVDDDDDSTGYTMGKQSDDDDDVDDDANNRDGVLARENEASITVVDVETTPATFISF